MIDTLHVTCEIGKYSLGGIATVINLLYKHSSNSRFLFVHKNMSSNNKAELLDDIMATQIGNMNSYLNKLSYNKIIFHNPYIAALYIKNSKFDSSKSYYVVHSNPIIEQGYKFNNLSNDDINLFIDILKNYNIITVSEYEKHLVEKICLINNIKIKSIQVIYNGINIDNGYETSIQPTTGNYGYIGRLDYRKGLTTLYEYWKELDYNLLVAGGGINRFSNEVLLELCNYQSKNIIHLGYCDSQRKLNFFNSIDALIVPSLYEPFGMILLESIINDKLILCNKTGGMVEILGEDYPFYFNIHEKSSLYDCINLFNEFKNKKDILVDLKCKIKNNFSIEKLVLTYENLMPIL